MSLKNRLNNLFFNKVEKVEDDFLDSEQGDEELLEELLKEEDVFEKEEVLEEEKLPEEPVGNTRDARKQKAQQHLPKERKEEYLHKEKTVERLKREKAETEEDKRRRVLVDVVIDGSYSMVSIYAKIYYMLKNLVKQIREESEEYRAIRVEFGLTILHERAEPQKFDNGTYFTEDVAEFLEALKKFSFHGGGEDGREPLNTTLLQALDIVNQSMGENTSAGILFFTDSIPVDDEMEPEFDEEGLEGKLNKGLRFAYIYSYQKKYRPILRMVDSNGKVVENGKNDAFYMDIEEDLIDKNLDVLSTKIEETMRAILTQLSMMVG